MALSTWGLLRWLFQRSSTVEVWATEDLQRGHEVFFEDVDVAVELFSQVEVFVGVFAFVLEELKHWVKAVGPLSV
jgi:hypothetical protein